MLSPEEANEKRDRVLAEKFADVADVQEKIRDLVASPGYVYVKAMGRQVLSKYVCPPPAKPEDQAQWETYTRMKYAIDKLFLDVEAVAAQIVPNQDKVPDADIRRKFRTRPDTGTSSGAAKRNRR